MLAIGAGIMGWDFLQLGRTAPELVSPEERADLIRVDKAARTLTLFHAAKRHQELSRFRSEDIPKGPRQGKVTDGLRRDDIPLIPGTATAASIWPCTFPIQTLKIVSARDSSAFLQAATS